MKDKVANKSWYTEDLTYITQHQLLELLKKYKAYKDIQKKSVIFGLVALIASLLVFKSVLMTLNKDYLYLALLLGLAGAAYLAVTIPGPPKKEYEKQKETFMKSLTGNFCHHGKECAGCKDTIARYLNDERDINIMS